MRKFNENDFDFSRLGSENLSDMVGSYIAYHKIEKKGMLVYGFNFSGYPTPKLTSVTLLKLIIPIILKLLLMMLFYTDQ